MEKESERGKRRLRKVRKFKNGNAAGKDEVAEEMIKVGCKRVVDRIWSLCNMAF